MVGVKGFGKLVAYVRDKLRALGLVSTWSDNDVAALVQKAREAAKSPTTVTRAGDLSRFSFAGMNAKTADKFALANALERLDAGENADTVRQETGWFVGPDGRARYEISDRDARLKMPASGKAGDALRGTTTVGALLNHAKLFAAYPGAAGIEVSTKPGEGASFQAAHEGRPARIRIGANMPMGKVTSALMHEIQHYVQRQEGFATGSNLLAAGSREAYFNSAGEVEARNVQTRLKMTDEERKGLAPHWTTDVLDQDVIVSFNGKDMAMVPAWHGSPHDFDRFSLDKIGTGEGAQAYGHGLYFAGKREIADYYRKTLSESRVLLNGEPADGATDRGAAARLIADGLAGGKTFDEARDDIAQQYAKYRDAAAKDAEGLAKRVGEPPAPGWGTLTITAEDVQQQRDRAKYYADKLAALNALQEGEVTVGKGRLYSVELAPAPDEYLLWDKPLSEQSEKVRAALSFAGIDMPWEVVSDTGHALPRTYETREQAESDAAKISGTVRQREGTHRGEVIYRQLSERLAKQQNDNGWTSVAQTINDRNADDKAASDYVIFNDADVSITAKFSRTGQAFANPMQGASFARAGEFLSDLFNTHGSFGRMKGLKTQYHKATLNPLFRGVWERANAMAMDSARAMSRPADLAPRILPKFDPRNMKEAAKAVFAGRSDVSQDDLKAVAGALNSGTLDGGPSPLNGNVWSRAELTTPKGQYVPGSGADGTVRLGKGLTDKQADLYEEARAAVDASLDETAAATAWKLARQHVPGQELRQTISGNPQTAATELDGVIEFAIGNAKDELAQLKKDKADEKDIKAQEKKIEDMTATRESIAAVFDKAEQLKDAGYMPLMRFGKYRIGVTMKDDNGETVEYVGRYESHFEANRARRELEREFPSSKDFKVGPVEVTNENEWKLYKGVNPETVMLFAEEAGIDTDEVMQKWYREAVSNRSALRRMVHRSGVAGYSEDLPRVLASFITSNGKQAGYAYHLSDMQEMLQNPDMPGDVQEEAQSLLETIQEPNEKGANMRGLMAGWYLLGSVASAITNATQTITMSLPWLSQFGAKGYSATEAAKALGNAYKMVVKPLTMPADLKAAMKRAEQEGVVDSNEVFHLYAESMKPALSKLGNGNIAYRARAFMTLWGAPFAMVETLNRRATFAAAYSMARNQGKSETEAAEFAKRAVIETQGVYAKHNRPNWARGTIGAAALTFRQYSIAYIEMLARMAKSGPEGRKAALLALGVLFMMAGASGLPGADDLGDLIDTFAQIFFDKPMLSRMAVRNALKDNLGKELGGFITSGMSEFMPIDVSARMGLGNLIPGTAMLKPSTTDKTGELLSAIGGVPGGFIESMLQATGMLAEGNFSGALKTAAPKAVQDVAKGIEMAATGEARDRSGKKVVDVGAMDAFFQTMGFNPSVKADAGRKAWDVTEYLGYIKKTESEIVGRWARGIADNDMEAVRAAQQELSDWNMSNPESPIGISRQQIRQRVQQLSMERAGRIEKTAPKELRSRVREMVEED